MFNDVQKGLLIEARKRIAEGEDQFICCAINVAVNTVGEVPYDTRFAYGRELKDQIDFGIDGYSSMELWLFSEVGVYPDDLVPYARDLWEKYAFSGWSNPVSREQFDYTCREARLAWIDRALENGYFA